MTLKFGDPCVKQAELIVEIAIMSISTTSAIWDVSLWDSAIWGVGTSFSDVSAYTRSVETIRKFSQDFKAWTAGVATVVLDNMDGRFSPDNLTGPYTAGGITGIRPWCPIRISVIYDSVQYTIFSGYVTEWSETWENVEGPRTGDAYMTLSCIDEWGNLAREDGADTTPAGAGESFGARVIRILNSTSFSGPVSVDTGYCTMQATSLSDDPVSELAVTAASEGGAIWVDADGTIVARDRYSLVEDSRSVNVQAMFGDAGPPEIPWSNIEVSPYSGDFIINYAAYTRVGGTTQTASDPVSISLYGRCPDKSSNKDTLLNQNDAEVLTLAEMSVAINKDPEFIVTGIAINPVVAMATLAPLALDLRIRDLISVIRRPPSATLHTMTRYCFVSGIKHTFAGGNWTTQVDTSSATKYVVFASSRWDTGLWGSDEFDSAAARWFF